jgi:hypothetical protein
MGGAVAVVERSAAKPVARYLLALRPVLQYAIASRETWLREIGALLEDVREGNIAQAKHDASRIGRERVGQFRECRTAIGQLRPPPQCAACHRAVTLWLDQLIAVCQLIEAVSRSGDMPRLGQIEDLLGESRIQARRFNGEYARLTGDLRAVVQSPAPARPRSIGPRFGAALAG